MQAVPSFDQLRRQVLQRRGRCLWGMARQLELGQQGLGVGQGAGATIVWQYIDAAVRGRSGATHRHGAKPAKLRLLGEIPRLEAGGRMT